MIPRENRRPSTPTRPYNFKTFRVLSDRTAFYLGFIVTVTGVTLPVPVVTEER